jgi:hypothetical protein
LSEAARLIIDSINRDFHSFTNSTLQYNPGNTSTPSTTNLLQFNTGNAISNTITTVSTVVLPTNLDNFLPVLLPTNLDNLPRLNAFYSAPNDISAYIEPQNLYNEELKRRFHPVVILGNTNVNCYYALFNALSNE